MKKSMFILFLFFSLKAFPKEIVISQTPCEYREISLFDTAVQGKSVVTYEEFVQDIDTLCYILVTGYAGYDTMVENGFDSEIFRQNLLAEFKNQEKIDSRKIFFALKEKLAPFVNDAHFQLLYSFDRYSFCEKSLCYWSDIYVREIEGEYFVQESKTAAIQQDEKYTGSTDNLFYYPAKGKNVYRLGAISSEKIEYATFNFEGKDAASAVFADGAIEIRPMKYKDFETTESAYIALNSFLLPHIKSPARKSADIIFKKLADCGYKYKDKTNIIIDLRSNSGGDTTYIANLFYCLYYGKKCTDFEKMYDKIDDWVIHSFSHQEKILSPVFYQAKSISYTQKKEIFENLHEIKENPFRKKIESGANPSTLFSKKSKYKGNLILLTDRNTVSAGEKALLMAKHIFGDDSVFLIGENTYGMSEYWNVFLLTLPNSGITLNTAFDKNLLFQAFPQWHGEGNGIYPDYWSTGQDLNETIYFITKDNEMKEKLKDIEYRLL